jgi:hypothetical protein
MPRHCPRTSRCGVPEDKVVYKVPSTVKIFRKSFYSLIKNVYKLPGSARIFHRPFHGFSTLFFGQLTVVFPGFSTLSTPTINTPTLRTRNIINTRSCV